MSDSVFVIYLLIMAVVTYLIRAIPFVLINKKIENIYIQSFLEYIPYTVLAAMTIPAIFYATSTIVTAVAGLIMAVILAAKEKSLLVVAIGASCAVFLTEAVMMLF